MPQLHSTLLVLALATHALGRFQPSFAPEDTYAFPKFRVNFVNNRPITPEDAQVLLSKGLVNGEDEFLGRTTPPKQEIEASGPWGDDTPAERVEPKLQRMKLGQDRDYLCLVPKSSTQPRIEPEEPEPVDPAKSWALLEPLTDTCLYHRQGWFTYAYCHNRYVSQFREKEHSHPHPPGGRIPQEDTDYQSYILGIAPKGTSGDEKDVDTRKAGKELQLASGGGQRYLTSRWTDGTRCDKTGKKREIEIQFHCGMTSTDSVQFLKETSVCKYLLVLHTPRLCGEPGFQSARVLQPAEPIHCREIMDRSKAASLVYTDPHSNFPYANTRQRNPVHLPNYALQKEKKAKAKAGGVKTPGQLSQKQTDALKKVVSQLYNKKGGKSTSSTNSKDKTGTTKDKGTAKDKTKGGSGTKDKGDVTDVKIDLDAFDDEFGQLLKGEDGDDPVFVQVLDMEGGVEDLEEALAAALRKQVDQVKKLIGKDRPSSKDDEDDEEQGDDQQENWYYDDAL